MIFKQCYWWVYAEGYCCSFKSIQTLSNSMDYGFFLFIYYLSFTCFFAATPCSSLFRIIQNKFEILFQFAIFYFILHMCICVYLLLIQHCQLNLVSLYSECKHFPIDESMDKSFLKIHKKREEKIRYEAIDISFMSWGEYLCAFFLSI